MRLIYKNPSIKQKELAAETGKSLSTVKRIMESLQKKDYIRRVDGKRWLILYASNFTDKRSYITESICSKDDKNDELLAKKDESIKLYKDASEASDLFDVWCET